jgi:hypothetical protein
MNHIYQLKQQINYCEIDLHNKITAYQQRHRQLQYQMANDTYKIKHWLPIAGAVTFAAATLLATSKRCRVAFKKGSKHILPALVQSKKILSYGKIMAKVFNIG